jgi:Tol biopolymer transport system component
LPSELDRIVRRALEKDRALRYQNAADLRAELKRLQRDTDSGQAVTLTTESARAGRFHWSGWTVTPLVALGVIIIVLAVWYLVPRFRSKTNEATLLKNASFTQLTDQAGQESFPSLSPDGNSFVYASRMSGNWDIYLQRVGGKNTINLTKDFAVDDVQPAFSPDGEHIAFRSEREGGGIFIMGATGESPRRLTDFGYYPAWAPNGKEIVCSLDDFVDPNNRTVIPGQLWAVNVASGEKRLVTKEDAAQPNWSPHGQRIAYWGVHRGGQRDIWTIPASGGEPVSVTDDAAVDWSPVWSPDGHYLYFASDRGGSMNLWRVAIDESSGKVLGSPEPITTPSVYSGDISFSSNGRRLAYVQTVTRSNLQEVSFDPQREKIVGTSRSITQGSKLATNPNLSPDGEQFVFDAVGDKQEDLFVVKRDGTGLRQLTNDAYKDRAPFWSPDGKKIVFFSDRGGRYESWTINPDGSGLQQLTYTTERDTQLTIWSPDGTRVLCNLQFGAPIILESGKTWQEQTAKTLSLGNDPDQWFMAYSWSLDGQKLAGTLRRPESVSSNIVSYVLASQQFEQLVNFGERPNWLSDSRRLLFFYQDKIYLLDSQSKKLHEVMSVAPNRIQALGISKDNRLIYYSLTTNEADVWLMTLE